MIYEPKNLHLKKALVAGLGMDFGKGNLILRIVEVGQRSVEALACVSNQAASRPHDYVPRYLVDFVLAAVGGLLFSP